MVSSAPTASPWTRLPPDLLLEVSGRLQHAADFVRFHAVCRPWRDAASLLTRPTCLPWVLASCNGLLVHSMVNYRFSFDTPTFHRSHGDVVLAQPPGAGAPTDTRNWVARADGTAVSLFVACPEPRLVDLHTGAITPLPPFPLDDGIGLRMKNPRGIIVGDGTVFLYNITEEFRPDKHLLTAAILRPNHAGWTIMEKESYLSAIGLCATYHNGHVLMCSGTHLLCAPTPNFDGTCGMFDSMYNVKDGENYSRECSYIFESGGDVLWASVLKRRHACYIYNPRDYLLSVSVHMLQQEPDNNGKMRWMLRDGRSLLGNHVLFLGSSASFATKLDEGGGCTYFVSRGGVFRYSFVDAEAKLVKWLRPGCCSDMGCMWLRPRLSFTSS